MKFDIKRGILIAEYATSISVKLYNYLFFFCLVYWFIIGFIKFHLFIIIKYLNVLRYSDYNYIDSFIFFVFGIISYILVDMMCDFSICMNLIYINTFRRLKYFRFHNSGYTLLKSVSIFEKKFGNTFMRKLENGYISGIEGLIEITITLTITMVLLLT